jgi:putative endonuclease
MTKNGLSRIFRTIVLILYPDYKIIVMAELHNNYVYIMSNKYKNVIYVGVTSNLNQRVMQHESGHYDGFTKKYNCHYLVYFEQFTDIKLAIEREKEIKGWRREKKNRLIKSFNPEWKFLNEDVRFL